MYRLPFSSLHSDSWVKLVVIALLGGLFSVPFVPSDAAAQGQSKVAVMPIQDKSGELDKETVEVATKYLRSGITASPGFIVIAEDRQNEKLSELIDTKKKKSYKSCYDEECQIPLGRKLAADSILRSEINYFGSCIFSVQVVDLAKEAAVVGAREDFKCGIDGLRGAIDHAIAKVKGGLGGESEPEKPAADSAKPARKILEFASKPQKASVVVDGEKRCSETPCSVKVSRGSHRVVMKKSGYRSKNGQLDVQESRKVEWVLEPVRQDPDETTSPSDSSISNTKREVRNGGETKAETRGKINLYDRSVKFSLGLGLGFGTDTKLTKRVEGMDNETFTKKLSVSPVLSGTIQYRLLGPLHLGVRGMFRQVGLGTFGSSRASVTGLNALTGAQIQMGNSALFASASLGYAALSGLEGNQFRLNQTFGINATAAVGGEVLLGSGYAIFAKLDWVYQSAKYDGELTRGSGAEINEYDLTHSTYGISTGFIF